LLGNADAGQKSWYAESNAGQNGINSLNNPNYQRTAGNGMNSADSNSSLNGNQINNSGNTQTGNNYSESNQMFEKILSEVIHVSTFEQRGNINNDIMSHPVTEMPFKIKGLLEPTRHHLTLPEGVPAPVTVLSAQPPFSSDIRLINNVAHDAHMYINGFQLNVPDNVAFDFNPIV
jgi:hypothetical protein